MKKYLLILTLLLLSNPVKADSLADTNYAGFGVNAMSVYNKAKLFEGMEEKKNRKELKKYLKIDPVEIPWCAAFVNSVLEELGFKSTKSLAAMTYAKYNKPTKTPTKGDIVVIKRNGGSGAHVGFFHGFKNGGKTVSILGGNQSNKVNIKDVPVSIVISYRKIEEKVYPSYP